MAPPLPADEGPLDNPVYAALSGPHERFAQVRGRARRYPPDVIPFIGMPEHPSAADWRDAADLVESGSFVAALEVGDEMPAAWMALSSLHLTQMVGERTRGVPCPDAVALGTADIPDMLELVAQTQPGPFLGRTVELGRYLGFRRDGALVAMAGERLRVEGWTEISAVCTLPADRGQGLASALMSALIAGIEERAERPFLHVLSTNSGAIRLYEQLGFRVRRRATLTVMAPEPG